MTDLERFKRKLNEHRRELGEEYSVSTIGLFGSYVRQDQATGSDLDILAEFSQPISLLRFVNLKRRLSEILDVDVDLVMKKAYYNKRPKETGTIWTQRVFICLSNGRRDCAGLQSQSDRPAEAGSWSSWCAAFCLLPGLMGTRDN